MGDRTTEENLATALNTRMGWSWGDPKCPFRRLLAVKCGERVALFVVHRDEAVLLYDSLELWPSDELVTKLRMLSA